MLDKLRILVEVFLSRERREDLYRLYGGRSRCGYMVVRGQAGTMHRADLIDQVDTFRLVQAIEAIEQRHAPLVSEFHVIRIRNHGNTTTRRPSPGEGTADS